MSLRIAGLGTAVPPHSIGQQEAAELSTSFCHEAQGRARGIAALYRRTGVSKRHSVLLESPDGPLEERQSFFPPAEHPDDAGPTTEERMRRYETEAPRLIVKAARQAIETSGIDPADLTHSVTVSCTGFYAPGVDAALVEELGLPRTIERTHVGFMGCHGALNGIRVATSFANSNPDAKILVSAVELCTLHLRGLSPTHCLRTAPAHSWVSRAIRRRRISGVWSPAGPFFCPVPQRPCRGASAITGFS